MKSINFYLVSLLLLATGCAKDFEPDISLSVQEATVNDESPQEAGVSLGRKFDNPYSLENMKSVYAQLRKTRAVNEEIDIKVTDLYVRFLPKNGEQYSMLRDSLKLELFNYPLDCELIGNGADYHDPSIPNQEMTWQYTTVKPDFKFPDNITYEILEECCIPDIDGEAEITRSGDLDLARQMEYLALENVGYIQYMEQKTGEQSTRGWFDFYKPKGKLQLCETGGVFVPLKGVKIRATTLITWGSTTTDANGNYAFKDAYVRNPYYSISFSNTQGFEVWGNAGIVTGVSCYNIGYETKKGINWNIFRTSYIWDIASVSNSAYEYYNNCKTKPTQYPNCPPSDNLVIWVHDGTKAGGAPMLKHVKGNIGYNPGHYLPFVWQWTNSVMSSLVNGFKSFMPDIMIGTLSNSFNPQTDNSKDYPKKYKNSMQIHYMVCHELSHASHYTQVGDKYWCNYINYIITSSINSNYKNNYGNKGDLNSGYCEVGEMWAYSMGMIEVREKFRKSLGLHEFELTFSNGWPEWFKPHIIWDLYVSKTLTKREIFNSMKSEIHDISEWKQKMCEMYPYKSNQIRDFYDNDVCCQ